MTSHLILEALRRKVITASSVPQVVKEWDTPSHDEFAERRNVWRLFNAVTEVAKQYKPEATLKRTTLLHGLLDAECGIVNQAISA